MSITLEQDTKVDLAVAQHAVQKAADLSVKGRYEQVIRNPMKEDTSFEIMDHIHDGPNGHGTTTVVERQDGDILLRKSVGTGPHSETHDWIEINVSAI